MHRSTSWILTLAALALVPASADAATTIGRISTPVSCSALPFNVVQRTGAPYAITEPGVLTSVQSGAFATPVTSAVRVYRPGPVTGAVTEVGAATMTGTGLLDGPARIRVLPGDLLAVGTNVCIAPAALPDETFGILSPPGAYGGPYSSIGTGGPGSLNVRAVEERDADSDGFGDETQDLCSDDATKQVACPPDVALTSSVADARVPVGGLQIMTMRVTASPDASAKALRVAATLPAGLELVGVSASQGACVGLDCALGTLPRGSSALVVAAVRPTTAGTKSISPTASVTNDTNPANNVAPTFFEAVAAAVAAVAPGTSGGDAAGTPAPGVTDLSGAAGPVGAAAATTTPRSCRVPKLTGFSRATAQVVLEAATCRLGTVKTQPVPRGRRAVGATRVVAQSVAAGQERPGATRVDLTLGRKTVARRHG